MAARNVMMDLALQVFTAWYGNILTQKVATEPNRMFKKGPWNNSSRSIPLSILGKKAVVGEFLCLTYPINMF